MTFGNNVISILPMLTERKSEAKRRRKKAQKKPKVQSVTPPLSEREQAVAGRLKAEFLRLAATEGLTEESFASRLKTYRRQNGMSQSMVNQYLNGEKHIGVEVFLRMCIELKIHPLDADPDFEFKDFVAWKLPPEVIRDARAIHNLPETKKEGIRKIIHP